MNTYERIAQLIYESLSVNEGSQGEKRQARKEAAMRKRNPAHRTDPTTQLVRLAYRGDKGEGATTTPMSHYQEGQKGSERFTKGVKSIPASSPYYKRNRK